MCNFYMQDEKVLHVTALFKAHTWTKNGTVVRKKAEHITSLLLLPQVVILFLGEKNQGQAIRVKEASHVKLSGERKSNSTKTIHEPMCTHMHTLQSHAKAKRVGVSS